MATNIDGGWMKLASKCCKERRKGVPKFSILEGASGEAATVEIERAYLVGRKKTNTASEISGDKPSRWREYLSH